MARLLRMPEVDDDPTDAMLTAWLVDEAGAFVGAQSLARVETESSVVSVEVSEPGVLLKVLVAPGDRVEPGRPLAVLGALGEIVDDIDLLVARLGVAVSPSARPDALRAPVARHTTWMPREPVGPDPGEREVTTTTVIAAPVHARFRATVRAEPLMAVVAAVGEVSTAALVVKAVVAAMRRAGAMPWSGASSDVVVERWDGAETVTSVVHVAGLMSASALTAALDQAEARSVSDAEHPAVLVVDLGSYGIPEATRDTTPGRPVVVTFGAVSEEAVVEDGRLVPGQVMVVSLTCDESRVDAGAAARWLAQLTELMEHPLQFLT